MLIMRDPESASGFSMEIGSYRSLTWNQLCDTIGFSLCKKVIPVRDVSPLNRDGTVLCR